MSMRAAGALVPALLVTVLLARPADAAGQQAARHTGPGATLTVHAGGTAFTRFQNVTVEAEGTSYAGELASSAAATLGADLALWFRPWVGVRLDFFYAPSNFELRLAEDDRDAILGDEADYRSLDYSDLSMFSATLTGVLALPTRSRHVAPYALLGAGAVMFVADERGANGLDRAFGESTSTFDVAGIAGLGVKIPLRDGSRGRIALSFELVDRITPTAIRADDGRLLLDDGTVRAVNSLHMADRENDARYVHSIGISAGLTFATGGATPIDPDSPQ